MDTLAAAVAVAGVVIALYENEDFYEEETETDSDGETKTTKDRNESTDTGNALRFANIGLTIVLLIMIFTRYSLKLNVLKLRRKRPPSDSLINSGLFPSMLLEMLICIVCTPPYFDATFSGEML